MIRAFIIALLAALLFATSPADTQRYITTNLGGVNLTLSTTSVTSADPVEFTEAVISATPAGNYTFSIVSDPDGHYEVAPGGNALRLKAVYSDYPAKTSHSVTIGATNGISSGQTTFVLNVGLYTPPITERFNCITVSNCAVDGSGNVQTLTGTLAGWTATQATAADRPALTANALNGRSCMTFDGVNDFLSVTTSAGIAFMNAGHNNTPYTIFFVGTQASSATGRDLIGWGSGSSIYAQLGISTGTTRWVGTYGDGTGSASSQSMQFTPLPSLNTPMVVAWSSQGVQQVVSSTSGPFENIYFNGQWYAGPAQTLASRGAAVTAANLLIGRNVAASNTFFSGMVCDIIIVPANLDPWQVEAYSAVLGSAAEWGMGSTVLPVKDLSNYTVIFNDDFSGGMDYNPTAATDFTTPTGWQVYNSPQPGLQEDYHLDPRSAATLFTNPYSQTWLNPPSSGESVGSMTTINSQPTPSNIAGAPTNNLPTVSGYAATLGWQRCQYCYFEARIYVPQWRTGDWAAFWTDSDTAIWPPEIDAYEQDDGFSGTVSSDNALHQRQYWPLLGYGNFSQTSLAPPYLIPWPDLSKSFHLIGFEASPTGICTFIDRKQTLCFAPQDGVYGTTVTAPGLGYTLPTAVFSGGNCGTQPSATVSLTNTGTLSATPLAVTSGGSGCDNTLAVTITGGTAGTIGTVTPTLSGGVLTGGTRTLAGTGYLAAAIASCNQPTITNTTLGTPTLSGTGIASVPVSGPGAYCENNPAITINGGLGTGATVTANVAVDQNVPMDMHTPTYLIINQAVATGVANLTDGSWPHQYSIDYVRMYHPNIAVPSVSVSNQAAAIISAYTSAGCTPSSAEQLAMNTFVAYMEAYRLRLDTGTYLDGRTDWNNSTQPAWSAFDAFYVLKADCQAAALINWINPGTNNLVVHGSPVFTAFLGYTFNHTVGQYLDTGLDYSSAATGVGLVRPYDHHLGICFDQVTTQSSLSSLMGQGGSFRIQASTSAHKDQMLANLPSASVMQQLALPAGCFESSRGNGRQVVEMLNSTNVWNGHVDQNNNSTLPSMGTTLLIGADTSATAGADFRGQAAMVGRRIMPDEWTVVSGLISTLFANMHP